MAPRPTTVGKSGQIVALATTIYNKPPFGTVARFSICDRSGRVLHRGEVKTPGQETFGGMEPGQQVLIRPETIGTMVKLLGGWLPDRFGYAPATLAYLRAKECAR